MVSIQVTRVIRTPAGSNAYSTDRGEVWSVQHDSYHLTRAAAETYVVRMNKKSIDGDAYIRLSTRFSDEDFLGSGSAYPQYLTYFVDQPPTARIRAILKAEGVSV